MQGEADQVVAEVLEETHADGEGHEPDPVDGRDEELGPVHLRHPDQHVVLEQQSWLRRVRHGQLEDPPGLDEETVVEPREGRVLEHGARLEADVVGVERRGGLLGIVGLDEVRVVPGALEAQGLVEVAQLVVFLRGEVPGLDEVGEH